MCKEVTHLMGILVGFTIRRQSPEAWSAVYTDSKMMVDVMVDVMWC